MRNKISKIENETGKRDRQSKCDMNISSPLSTPSPSKKFTSTAKSMQKNDESKLGNTVYLHPFFKEAFQNNIIKCLFYILYYY